MFGYITDLITLSISTLLPTFLTYKALSLPSTQQTAQTLHPWLTYWVINSLVLSAPRILPFDSYIRLGLHIYLLIPGRAESLYQSYAAPWLREHEAQIEDGIADLHARARSYIGDIVGKAQELLLGDATKTRLRAEQQEEEERRSQVEASAGGYVGGLLARWTSAASVQEQKHLHANHGTQPATLATRLGALANAAAVAGVGKLEQTVNDVSKKAPSAQDAGAGRLGGLNPFGASASTQGAAIGDDLKKSKSETDFEKIEQHDAPSIDGKEGAKNTAGWTSWIWGNKSTTNSKAAKAE